QPASRDRDDPSLVVPLHWVTLLVARDQTAPERCHAFRFLPGFDQVLRRRGAGVFVFGAATGCASSLRGWTPPRTEGPHLYRVVRRRRGRRGRDRELASNTF